MLNDFCGKKTVQDCFVLTPELHFENFNVALLSKLCQRNLSFLLLDKNIKFIAGFSYNFLPGKTERPQNGLIDVNIFFSGSLNRTMEAGLCRKRKRDFWSQFSCFSSGWVWQEITFFALFLLFMRGDFIAFAIFIVCILPSVPNALWIFEDVAQQCHNV
jgi:hypothetical protein